MSLHDYEYLTALQKAQCKPIKSTADWVRDFNMRSDNVRFAVSMLNELRRRLYAKITNDIHDVEVIEIEKLIKEIEEGKL